MIKAITGTKDILPDEINKWLFLEIEIRKLFSKFNYNEIRTPIFEETNLFSRSIGNDTDIVSKEMYSFEDKSGKSITLKPEMTASVVRALIEHSLTNQQPLNKVFYISPMFRQERPQAGRLRQFHQFGAEAIGSLNPELDAEIIIIANQILKNLGLKEIFIKINSLGTSISRKNYLNVLNDFLLKKKNLLSDESRKKLEQNILRIFDSKDSNDIEIMNSAPLILNYLDEQSFNHFEKVKQILAYNEVHFEIEPKLVRGLDYYTHTTFEIISNKVGAQNALCGGGRYDNLIEELGGKPTPAVGFAAGIERIILAMENENVFNLPKNEIDIFLIRLSDDISDEVFKIANFLRNNFTVEIDYLNRSVKAQMREANRLNAKYVAFVGGDEYNANSISLKDMNSGIQKTVLIKDLLNELKVI